MIYTRSFANALLDRGADVKTKILDKFPEVYCTKNLAQVYDRMWRMRVGQWAGNRPSGLTLGHEYFIIQIKI